MEIFIDGNYSNIRFSSAHFIPGDWKCSRIHGHDYSISVRIIGSLNGDSYFLDFSKAKSNLKEIADFLDHRVLIPGNRRGIVLEEKGGYLKVDLEGKSYTFPLDETRVIPVKDTTAECLSEYILEKFVKSLEQKVEGVEVEVHEGPGQYAKSTWKH
ncbi:MAG: 6-carboxytetrahydropterin synthase [Candidatus Thermoplasmatota archaeon]|nr:6-carboxytetrahydropterin synthase [Candidatus Thermoplasmatota archaeon]MCL5789431.1 6-carboxytetrahydropterin synthase [Candidatus Thermoplasmatota archaeon]